MRLRDQLPELDGATKWLNSKPLSKDDLTGHKPLLIHFWSISCDTCQKAMPKVNEFRDAYKNDLNVIAVHMPRNADDEDVDAVRRAAKAHNITEPVFVDHKHHLTNRFKNRYVPAYYVFDHNGRLRHRQSGSGGLTMLQKRVDRVLNETEK